MGSKMSQSSPSMGYSGTLHGTLGHIFIFFLKHLIFHRAYNTNLVGLKHNKIVQHGNQSTTMDMSKSTNDLTPNIDSSLSTNETGYELKRRQNTILKCCEATRIVSFINRH